MDLSVVVPLYNESESLPELVAWIERVVGEKGWSHEIILADDGSTDGSWDTIRSLSKEYPSVRGISFRRNYGKSAALYEGFAAAQGKVVITMDADLQDSPDEIPELYRMITEDGYDLVSGWKKVRYDSKIAKNIPSKFFNWTTRKMSGIKLHDFNCGLKAYRKDVVKSIEVYSEMHRYIPVIAKWAGFSKIGEKVVIHQKRKYGVTKFGWNRFVNGYLDLLTISFTTRFGKKPMHAFGLWGSVAFLVGFVCAIWLIVAKLVHQSHGLPFRQVTDQPLFFIALLGMVLGFMLFLAGFLGEMIARNGSDRNKYLISDRIE